jgi:hypothetical protein
VNLGGGTLTVNQTGPNTFSGSIQNSELVGSSTATGHGLRGYYYDNLDFTSLKAVRDDATVNFGDLTSPAQLPAAIYPNTNQVSARWLGQVLRTTGYSRAQRQKTALSLSLPTPATTSSWNSLIMRAGLRPSSPGLRRATPPQ